MINMAKYSQRVSTGYAYFIHKINLVRDKSANPHNKQRKLVTSPLCNGTIRCTFSSNRLVHNKPTRCCTVHNNQFVSSFLYVLKHKDSFGKSENLSKIFFSEIIVFDHDYEGKSSSSNGLLWISFIYFLIIYLNYFSNCSEGLRTNL